MNKLDVSAIPEGEVPKNIDDFTCKICSFIIHDPHECENCGTPYCKDCLELWHQKSSQCPIKCGVTLKIKPAHRFVRRMIGELKVKCSTEECTEIIELSRLEPHLKECQHLSVKCPNEDCDVFLKRKDIPEHILTCKYKEISCERCFEKIKLCLNDLEKIENNKEGMIQFNNNHEFHKQHHDCVKMLGNKVKLLLISNEQLSKKTEIFEKEIFELKEKTNLLMSNISYKCDNAHPLIFRATWTSTCSCCGLIKICTRWECASCKKNYCLDCIRLLNSVFCPNFHTFLFGDRGNFLCDICGAKKTQGGPLSLHDPVCDFDLCDNCVVRLFPNIHK
jgi:hypothetical protein